MCQLHHLVTGAALQWVILPSRVIMVMLQNRIAKERAIGTLEEHRVIQIYIVSARHTQGHQPEQHFIGTPASRAPGSCTHHPVSDPTPGAKSPGGRVVARGRLLTGLLSAVLQGTLCSVLGGSEG